MNKHFNNIAIFIILFFFGININGLELSKSVRGIVIDSETSKPVSFVVIQIKEISQTITADEKGVFKINNLDFGNYTFVLNHIGYSENISRVKIDDQSDNQLVFYLIPKTIELNAVIVSDYKSYSKFEDLNELSNVLKGKELQKEMGLTLAATLKNETGLAMRSMGPAPSRPVIRGLGSNRVIISEDGVNTVDLSATSPDHAVTIDPFSIDRIEVLRGAKVLTQTSTTIGGIVNVVRKEIPIVLHDALTGSYGTYFETVNNGYLGFLALEIPYRPFSFRTEISRRISSNLNTPKGTLENTNSKNFNFSFASSYFTENALYGISFRDFNLDYGIPGGFIGAHPNGVDISISKNQLNYLNKINFENKTFEDLEITLSRVYYRHKEFESSGLIGSEFQIINYSIKFQLNNNAFKFFDNGIVGISADYKNFEIGGFVFTPPSTHFNTAFFAFENIDLNKLKFELSARFNYDNIKPQKENPNSKIGNIRQRIFNTFSASTSVLYEISKIVYVGANISRSSRTPTIEELFSQGPHLAAYSYEVGNPDLEAESGIGSEIFIYHKFEKLFFNLNFFRNVLNDYIIPRNSGEINYATFLPIYVTTGVDAVLWGIENRIDWKVWDFIEISNTFSFTSGKLKSGGFLPQIPPMKGLLELKYFTQKLNIGISAEWASRQIKLDHFEQPTKGYLINNIFIQYSFNFNKFYNNISLSIDNVFNKEYRNHLSRVKSILPEAGRNVRLSLKGYFHL